MARKAKHDLHKPLKEIFGFDHFKERQEEIINCVMNGKDCSVIMPTGGGKSLCYQLPAMLMEGTAIIISPLIALMKNQVDSVRNFTSEESTAHVYNSSLSRPELRMVREDLLAGKTKMLYMAPESLIKKENVEMIRQLKISFFAIDEAHCISEWGHDFRPEYRKIREIIDNIGQKVPVMALTATATPKVRIDIQKNLKMQDAEVFLSSFNRPNIYYEIREKTADVDKEVLKIVKSNPGKSGIIYCFSRKKVEELAEFLQINHVKALPYHAGLDGFVRMQNQDSFLMEDADVIVATIAFGMGIDKPDIRYVIHYDIPKSLEGYYQETGRAGRDDGEARCIAFYDYEDLNRLERLAKGKPVAEQEIARQLLSEVMSYAESTLCRRRHLLFYFGETYDKENCGCCDNCLHPRQTIEGKEYILILLTCIRELKQQFKDKHIISIIRGEMTNDIKKFKHNTLSSFGEGREWDEKFWEAVIRQALFAKLIVKEIENYGILKISTLGEKFLKRPYSIPLAAPHQITDSSDDMDDDDDEAPDMMMGQKGGVVDKALYSMLKDMVKTLAKKENLPPYVIFQDTSLEDMCVQYPTTLEEMTQITGVGIGKAQKYGKPFVALIRKYVEDNEIERPQDLVVKSAINKSGLKVSIIQNIDRRIDFEDIAASKKLTMDELLTVIERIVISGIKLDINYYIDEVIDEGRQEEIMDYLQNSESDDLEKALVELGEDDYTLEELRLMRIKFLSDVGN